MTKNRRRRSPRRPGDPMGQFVKLLDVIFDLSGDPLCSGTTVCSMQPSGKVSSFIPPRERERWLGNAWRR